MKKKNDRFACKNYQAFMDDLLAGDTKTNDTDQSIETMSHLINKNSSNENNNNKNKIKMDDTVSWDKVAESNINVASNIEVNCTGLSEQRCFPNIPDCNEDQHSCIELTKQSRPPNIPDDYKKNNNNQNDHYKIKDNKFTKMDKDCKSIIKSNQYELQPDNN